MPAMCVCVCVHVFMALKVAERWHAVRNGKYENNHEIVNFKYIKRVCTHWETSEVKNF